MYQECLANSNERVVAIGAADEETVLKGLETVLSIIDTTTIRTPARFFDPENQNQPLEIDAVQDDSRAVNTYNRQQLGVANNDISMGGLFFVVRIFCDLFNFLCVFFVIII